MFAIDRARLYDSDAKSERSQYGFRKTQVWIGTPGSNIDNAIFAPQPANEISKRMMDLLNWWRAEYMKLYHADADIKVQAIANFHADFFHIHPFLDVNWRFSRKISTINCRMLRGKAVRFPRIEAHDKYCFLLQETDKGS